jgi:ATP-dependent DNA helicase RecG
MSLQKLIKDGEGKTIEFKAELPNSNTLAKTIIAFSNTGGGKLIVGVNDQGEIIGLEPDVNILIRIDKGPQTHYKLVDKD